ncbi:ABC transporter ATP-binding protein [Lentibacillus saliphilus]|uniref:ABC transporter ATP-binding protein n=1 Tax=Lentibacillus saliphilus TaxID=2737028 RepID=UPI001C301362|nr:ABC transporter ATP-binding protein [Lentibacillus saliphilus]
MKEAVEAYRQYGWKKFFQLMFKSRLPWTLYIISIITAFLTTTISLGLPIVTQKLMEGKIFEDGLVTQYVLLSVASAVMVSISAFFAYVTGPITRRNIQQTIWPKLIRMPMRKYAGSSSLQQISRVTIDPSFVDSAISDLRMMLTATYSLVGSFVIMYNMNVKLTLALLPIIPYILIVSAVVGHFTQKTQYGVQEKLSGLTAFFAERLPKIRLIKTFGKEAEEIERGHAVIHDQYGAEKKRAVVDLFAEPLMQSVRAIVVGIVLIYGSILVSRGELKVSEVIAFYLYVQFIHNDVLKYGIFWQSVKQARGAAEKISGIRDAEEEKLQREHSFDTVADRSSGDITFENVSFSYGEKNVLSHINLTIPEGKTTAIVGPSGSGKTTIFSLIERLYEPNVGRVMIGDTPAEDIHLDEWRQSIAYVSQSAPLLSGTIRDNITYGIRDDMSDEEVINAAKLAAAYEFIEEFPDGLDTEVGEFGSRLSGGQRQRLAIARAFIMNPDYLLLDEATSNLDARSEHLVHQALQKLMRGRTTIMISHDLKDIGHVHQVILVDQGKIVGTGNHKDLMGESDLYQKLVDIQNQKSSKLAATM